MTNENAINILRHLIPPRTSKAAFDAFRQAIEMAIEALKEPHWILVTERLPEVGKNVLLSYFDEITIGWLNNGGLWSIYDGWKCVNADEISAWMPLPEPYKLMTK